MKIFFEGKNEDLLKVKEYIEKGFDEAIKENQALNLEKLNYYKKIELDGNRMIFETNFFDVLKDAVGGNRILKAMFGHIFDKAKRAFVDRLKEIIRKENLNVNIVKTEL